MSNILFIMTIGACLGGIALYLISGNLVRQSGLNAPGKILLTAAIGLGVIAVSIKVLLVGYLMEKTRDHHPQLRPAERSIGRENHGAYAKSAITSPWLALPVTPSLPPDTPLQPDLVKLGKRLFNEKGLSLNGDVACSSCHILGNGGDDDSMVSTGIFDLRGTRNAPTVWNAAFLSRLFWDGRATSLEDQAKGPFINPVEMGMPTVTAVEEAVRSLPGYAADFEQAFGSPHAITIENITSAIASYERTLIVPDTAYDRFVRGEAGALTPQQMRGMALFAGIGCRNCHRDPTFSAAGKIKAAGVWKPFPAFSNNSYVQEYNLMDDRGRADSQLASGPGLWRVPSLRNVANTAPYFHNGSVDKLEKAITIMAITQLGKKVVAGNTSEMPVITWEPDARKLSPYRPRVLTRDDIKALAAFLGSLSDAGDTMSAPVQ
ncbi:cytochrome-c peroxidase [Emcibacter nanhaiensis]|uniref:C-type cytochrome n=1 Tax=Emcibacter nanhaiensis TaxID=1505037 RepID=A0A501PHH2_9PROT|nr:cytochrome c peroxidase [Emcibacter nanhaiensis]TPD59296.1 c-type cytochrome [Emcibacter nanhaiensis]